MNWKIVHVPLNNKRNAYIFLYTKNEFFSWDLNEINGMNSFECILSKEPILFITENKY